MGLTIYKNIGAIIGADPKPAPLKAGKAMGELSIQQDAWMAVADDRIMEIGSMETFSDMSIGGACHPLVLRFTYTHSICRPTRRGVH